MRKDVALALLGLHDGELNETRINEAYRAAMRLNHPDRYADNEKLRRHAEEQCKLINEARRVLLSQAWDAEDTEPIRDDVHAQAPSSHEPDERESVSHSDADGRPEASTSDHGHPIHSSSTPFLDIWHTSTGASVLGVLLFLFVLRIEYIVPEAYVVQAGILRFAYMVFQIFYSSAVYSSLFGLKPRMGKSASVSFWNCAVGGFVFGPLWNGNLTKRQKGISNVVFVVMVGLLAASWLVMFGFAAAVLVMR